MSNVKAPAGSADRAARYCESNFQRYLGELKALARIPSISFAGFPASEMKRSAEAVAELLKKSGLEKVQLLEVPGAHPYVYGERMKAPGAPTLLLYAHHDVQPAGRAELWKSSPFEPTVAPGPGGDRLYGRGTADDKAGILVHAAAIDSYLKSGAELPVNVKIVIEGEEETGSAHLPEFLRKYRPMLDADVLVLTDTTNFDCGVPALTVALRGLVAVDVEVRALTKSVHSGMWGGPIPDPVVGLAKMIAGMLDQDGKIAVPGVLDDFRPLSADEERELNKIPYSEAEFRKASGLVPSAKILRQGPNPAAQTWRYPSLTVTAIQASSRAQAANIINDVAWARVTVRLAAGMHPHRVTAALKKYLQESAPWGLEIAFGEDDGGNGPWETIPKGPAFDAAEVAMKRGYGREPLKIGCGGSIPFVQPFADALGGVPALLIGVEDPYTNAHGENESLLISDLLKSCVSHVHLFEELAKRMAK